MLIFILVAAVLYAFFDFFVAKGAERSDAYVANVIFNGLGAAIPLAIFLIVRARHAQGTTTKYGIVMNVLAGIAIAAFSIILVKIFAKGGNLAYVLPVIYGSVVVLGSVLGYVFLHEKVSVLQLLGIVVTACGVSMVVAAKV